MKNRPSKTILVFFALGLISCALCVQQAQAVPMTLHGVITFAGGIELNSSSVNTATKVTGWLDGNGALPRVKSASGNFAAFASAGDTATFTPTWNLNSGAITAFWKVDGFTFNLIASHIVFQGGGFLAVSGTGTISGHGFSSTRVTWRFTAQNPAARGVFSFSDSFTAIPDGGNTVALLGLALAGIEGIRRKLKRAKRPSARADSR
jgi:hypothetical protein